MKEKKVKQREVKRKVLFYHMSCKTIGSIKKRLKGKAVKRLIENIFSTKDIKFNKEEGVDIKSKLYEYADGNVVLDLIDMNDDYAFIRMGKEKDINSYQKRDYTNLTPEKIALAAEQYIEVFSFFVLDLNNMIISLIFSQGAPGVKHFSAALIESKIKLKTSPKKIGVATEISAVPNDDIIKVMKKMNYFSSFEMSFAIPSNDVFSEVTGSGLSSRIFKKFSKMESKGVTITIKGDDKKVSNNYETIREVTELIYDMKNNKVTDLDGTRNVISRCKVAGKFGDAQMQTLNVFDEAFTWQITLKHDMGTTYIPIMLIKDHLINLYESQETDIMRLVGTSDLNY